jgi:hypothetical protein
MVLSLLRGMCGIRLGAGLGWSDIIYGYWAGVWNGETLMSLLGMAAA